MHFVTREFVCDRLRVSNWASYGLIPATKIHMVSSDDVVAVLNRSRRGREAELAYIPSDIVTAEEIESRTGIPKRKIMNWTRRRTPVPHYRINKQTTRFRLSSVTEWLAKNSRRK